MRFYCLLNAIPSNGDAVSVALPFANQCADKNHFLNELGSGERETDYSQALSSADVSANSRTHKLWNPGLSRSVRTRCYYCQFQNGGGSLALIT